MKTALLFGLGERATFSSAFREHDASQSDSTEKNNTYISAERFSTERMCENKLREAKPFIVVVPWDLNHRK